MRTIKNVAILGLGGLGCAYGSKLYDLMPDSFRVIANKERINRYTRDGFVINGRRYDFPYADADEKGEAADLIMVLVKTHQLTQAVHDMRNYVGDNTIILSLLNGITSEEIIGRAYGMDKMLYAVSYQLTPFREGNDVRFSGYGNIAFGEKDNTVYSDKVKAVREFFDRTAVPYTIPDDMMRSLWWKFMVNVGINQCSAVTRGRYGLFQREERAIALMESAMWEVVHLSEKAGIYLNAGDLTRWREMLGGLNPDNRTSMLEDIESGRSTEVDAFAGTVCELGQQYGVETPVNATLLRIIKLIEAP